MKSKLNPVPAANRTQEKINNTHHNKVTIGLDEAQKLVTGIYKLDAEVKLKDSQIATITKQKNDLQQMVTTKTVEVQNKAKALAQKEQLLSELRIREENQLKEEYINVLHQLNPKVFSANYEEWTDKAQGYKDLIVKGNYKTIKKHIPIHKQKLEREKLALATKEAERLDKSRQEAVNILHQLHPTLYPANFEEWSTHSAAQSSKAKKVLDSGNLQAIEKNLVTYRELLKKELTNQKQEVQNKAQLILQKEQELKSLNDTFLTKEEEIAREKLKIAEVSDKVKKTNRKLAAKDKLLSDKDQEIEALKALLALKEAENQAKDELLTQKDLLIGQKDELLSSKELEKQELVRQKEIEKQELLAQKEEEVSDLRVLSLSTLVEVQEKEVLVKQREGELLIKNILIDRSQVAIDGLVEVNTHLKDLNHQLSHVDLGIQMTGNEVGTQVTEIDLAGQV